MAAEGGCSGAKACCQQGFHLSPGRNGEVRAGLIQPARAAAPRAWLCSRVQLATAAGCTPVLRSLLKAPSGAGEGATVPVKMWSGSVAHFLLVFNKNGFIGNMILPSDWAQGFREQIGQPCWECVAFWIL